jgi:hypothetical protein
VAALRAVAATSWSYPWSGRAEPDDEPTIARLYARPDAGNGGITMPSLLDLLYMALGAGAQQEQQQAPQRASQSTTQFQPGMFSAPIREQNVGVALGPQFQGAANYAANNTPAANIPADPNAAQTRGGGGNIVEEIWKIASSPAVTGGLAATLMTPGWASAPYRLGAGMMGAQQGAQAQAEQDYRAAQAGTQQQELALRKQKLDLEREAQQWARGVWDTLSDEEKKLAQFPSLNQIRNPNLYDLAMRAASGDVMATRAFEILEKYKVETGGSKITAMDSIMRQAIGEGLTPGTDAFNRRVAELEMRRPGPHMAEKRFQAGEEARESSIQQRIQNDLEQFKQSYDYLIAQAESEQKARQLLDAERRRLEQLYKAKQPSPEPVPQAQAQPTEKSVREKFGL